MRVFPMRSAPVFQGAMVQTCIVHLLRNSLDFVT
jgi:transposase-like protein